MRSRLLSLAVASLALGVTNASAQAAPDSAEAKDYFLHVTHEWGRKSSLGDPRTLALGADDIELRVWGFFFFNDAVGVVLRRTKGEWQQWSVHVAQCSKWVPVRAADTASALTTAGYLAAAKKECHTDQRDVPLPARGYTVDTVAVSAIASGQLVEQTWKMAVANGVLTLPARWPPNTIQLDGVGYFIELRRGTESRISTILAGDGCGTGDVDRQIRGIWSALTWLRPRDKSNGERE
jgi:hypothetical protein